MSCDADPTPALEPERVHPPGPTLAPSSMRMRIAEARQAGTKAAIDANAVEEDPTRLRMVDSPSGPQLMLDNTLCERDPAQILSPGHIEVFLTAVDEEPSSKQAGGAAGASPDGAERGRRFKVSTPSPCETALARKPPSLWLCSDLDPLFPRRFASAKRCRAVSRLPRTRSRRRGGASLTR